MGASTTGFSHRSPSLRSRLAGFGAGDDCGQPVAPGWRQPLGARGRLQRQRARRLSVSERRPLLLVFPPSPSRTFTAFYTPPVLRPWQTEFPGLVSSSRFVECTPSTLGPLGAYLRQYDGSWTGPSFVDAPALAGCHNHRIAQPKVFADLAARGRTSGEWVFGFQLHLVVNDRGELLRGARTPGNTDARQPVPQHAHSLFGKLFADKDSLSVTLTTERLTTLGGHLLTPLKRNMKPRRLLGTDKLLRRTRAIVAPLFDQLKNISQIEHSRHRSPRTCLVHLLWGLSASCQQPKKPSPHLTAYPTFPLA